MALQATFQGGTTGGTSLSVNLTSITTGDSLVVAIGGQAASTTISTALAVTGDSPTITQIDTQAMGTVANTWLYRIDGVDSAASAVTVTLSANGNMFVYRIHGHTNTLTYHGYDLDLDNITTAATSGDLGTDSYAATTSTDKVAVAFCIQDRNTSATTSSTDSFTLDASNASGGAQAETACFSRVFTNATLTPDYSGQVNDQSLSYLVVYEDVASGVTGTTAVTETADVVVGSGTQYSNITSTTAVTETADLTVAAGNVTGSITSTTAVTETADAAAAAGTVMAFITSTTAITETADVAAASGTQSAANEIIGTSAITETADIVVAAAIRNTTITGTTAVTEEDDTAYAYDQLVGGWLPASDKGVLSPPLRNARQRYLKSA